MGWLSLISCFGLSLWLIWRYFRVSTLSKNQLISGFTIKIAFVFVYILLFTYYFSDGSLYGDSARFFQDSQIIQSVFWDSPSDFFRLILGLEPITTEGIQLVSQTGIWAEGQTVNWVNDNRVILKLNAFIHFFSFGNVYVHALVFGFLSFTGTFFVYKSFEKLVSNKVLFWWAIIAFPNLAFWGTSLLKESLFIFAFGIWCWAIVKLAGKHFKYGLVLVLAGSVLLLNKPYAGSIIVGFSAFLLGGKWLQWSKKGLIALSFISILLFGFSLVIPGKLNLTNRLSIKQNDLNNLAKGGIAFITDSSFCVFPHHQLNHFEQLGNDWIKVLEPTKGEYKLFGQDKFYPFTIWPSTEAYAVYLIYEPSHSYSPPTLIGGSPVQLLKNSGSALMNVFVRPFPTDNGDQLKYMSFLSNLIFLSFMALVLMKRKKINGKESYLVAALLGASLVIALIIGWSVPIFGAIVRYKIPVELLTIIFAFIILKPLKNGQKL